MKKLTLFSIAVIQERDLPAVAFTYDPGNWFSRLIHHRTGGPSHVMWLHKPGRCATQGFTFHEEPIFRHEKSLIEVWTFPTWTERDRERYREEIQRQIERHGLYDFLGVLGHALWIPILNIPFLDYCSEQVYNTFRRLENLPRKHPTPAEFRDMLPFLQGDLYGGYIPHGCKAGSDFFWNHKLQGV